ncbi:hypothetical protein BCR43DRAFT_55441 [Syncephalastrum racemosum]|uniref:Uncharacterized protein n=1 Tax=Syncephalastrum racemosum TaxID=13706 RepID=A0A1X2HVJ5_SYNRA|nr:hypothetical protein BCR43DRAFT_55441 [Syncephalastrum racemosum]
MDADLPGLVDNLSRQFEQCLESILADPQLKEADDPKEEKKDLDAHVQALKSITLELERRFKDIRLNCLQDNQLSVDESIRLLKRDIEIKQQAVERYTHKLDAWSQQLPVLKDKSRACLERRTDGRDFDEPVQHGYIPKSVQAKSQSQSQSQSQNQQEQQQQEEQQHGQPSTAPHGNANEEDDEDDEDAVFEEV